MLKTIEECFNYNIFHSEWLTKIKRILDECGMSFVWNNPSSVTTEWLSLKLKKSLQDIFIQNWHKQCLECSKSCHYHLYKPTFELEKYLIELPFCLRVAMTKLRTSNHKLPIEKGRYRNLPRYERHCNLCNTEKVGDEFHFLLECHMLDNIRTKYIPKYYYVHPNFYKYSRLLALKSKNKLLNLSKFIKEGLSLFK